MQSIAARTQTHLVTRTARTLGVPLPDAFTAQLDDGSQLVDAAEAIARPDQMIAAVLNALAEGRDYHTDKQIQRMLLDSVLVGQLNIGGAARERAD